RGYFLFKKFKKSFNSPSIEGVFKFFKRKIVLSKSVDYLGALTYYSSIRHEIGFMI
ncbi:MAG: hypothetical protein ACJAYJ_002201, partial [Saprospiraceae bacterium]